MFFFYLYIYFFTSIIIDTFIAFFVVVVVRSCYGGGVPDAEMRFWMEGSGGDRGASDAIAVMLR